MSVCVIIPAFNEEKTIGEVVSVANKCDLVDQVIVVNDGSTDQTAQIARAAGARVIDLKENMGKGAAIQVGINECDADIVTFLDADLIGLETSHVIELVKPVLLDEVDMTIGLFGGGRVATDLAQLIAPHLTGQRALRKSILQSIPNLEITRFGVEIVLTKYAKENGLRVKEVVLHGLTHRMKEEKLGISRGLAARMKMYWEILKSVQRT